MDAVREHERDLVAYASRRSRAKVPAIELYGPLDPDLRGGVVPFNLPGIHPHDVAQVLDRSGIAVRAGHHCTMPLHERLDLPATARASFNVYSTREDIDALVTGLHDVQRVFGRRLTAGGAEPPGASRPTPTRHDARVGSTIAAGSSLRRVTVSHC